MSFDGNTFSDGRLLEHVLHSVVDVQEGGAGGSFPVPALLHQVVHFGGAPRGAVHPVARLQQLVDVRQLHPRVGRHPVGGNLPQEDAERPHVAFEAVVVVLRGTGLQLLLQVLLFASLVLCRWGQGLLEREGGLEGGGGCVKAFVVSAHVVVVLL